MSGNLLGEVVGNNGTFVVNTGTRVNLNCDSIVVTQDTIFEHIYILGADVKETYIQDHTLDVRAGTIITPIGDSQFSGVKLVSGQVTLVLG